MQSGKLLTDFGADYEFTWMQFQTFCCVLDAWALEANETQLMMAGIAKLFSRKKSHESIFLDGLNHIKCENIGGALEDKNVKKVYGLFKNILQIKVGSEYVSIICKTSLKDTTGKKQKDIDKPLEIIPTGDGIMITPTDQRSGTQFTSVQKNQLLIPHCKLHADNSKRITHK